MIKSLLLLGDFLRKLLSAISTVQRTPPKFTIGKRKMKITAAG